MYARIVDEIIQKKYTVGQKKVRKTWTFKAQIKEKDSGLL